MPRPSPRITIILATYDRPSALYWAIAAALLQSVQDWRLIVIGDACGTKTADVVAGFGDPRIRFVNLQQRCGEQSGPNSVGLELADTDFIAFLNHDDVWLPDHIEIALSRLEESGADFFVGRAAFATECKLEPDRLVFTECTPRGRRLSEVFYRPGYFFEPCSAWVLRREAVRRVGRWRAATELHRTPLEDWVLRAWRAGLRVVGGDLVTTLKPRLLDAAKPPGRPEYDRAPPSLADWLKGIATDINGFRGFIETDVCRAEEAGLSRSFHWPKGNDSDFHGLLNSHLSPLTAWIFWLTGWDAYDRVCAKMGFRRGRVLRWALERRTGETLQPRPDLELLIADARRQLDGAAEGASNDG